MSHRRAFETLADRGSPIGAQSLIDRVEADLTGSGLTGLPGPRRRWSGPAIALAGFGLVIALGLAWALLSSPGDDAIGDPQGLVEIEWVEVDVDAIGVPFIDLVAGPGGFVATSGLGGGPGIADLWFSRDGRDWAAVELPELADFVGVQVQASNTRWLARSFFPGEGSVWVSEDGTTWQLTEFPGRDGAELRDVVASDRIATAITVDVFGEGAVLWTLDAGAMWTRNGGDAAPELVAALDDGAWLWPVDEWLVLLERPEASVLPLRRSTNGVDWDEGSIVVPDDLGDVGDLWNISMIERLDEGWVAVAELSMRDRPPVVQAWTSSDGLVWAPASRPDLGIVEPNATIVAAGSPVGGRFLAVAPGSVPTAVNTDGFTRADGVIASSGEIWITGDGVSWQRGFAADRPIASLAGAVVDGVPTVVWAGRYDDEATEAVGSPVETTMAPVTDPQEINPDGVAYQDEVLADGVVTLDELRTAFDGWKLCMEDRGLIEVSYEIRPDGSVSRGYGSVDRFAGEAENQACSASWVSQIETGPFGPDPVDSGG